MLLKVDIGHRINSDLTNIQSSLVQHIRCKGREDCGEKDEEKERCTKNELVLVAATDPEEEILAQRREKLHEIG